MKKLALATAGALALAAPAAASAPLVPTYIQTLVRQKAGTLAYVPTRAPFRYAYVSHVWNARDRMLTIRIADRRFPRNGRHTVAFTAERFSGDCSAGNQQSFQLDGNKVYSDTNVAWRCVNGVKLLASGPNLPAVALGQVVASGKRVREP